MTTTQIPNPQTFGQNGCCTPFPGQTFPNVPFNWCGPTQTGYPNFTNQYPTNNFGYTSPSSWNWPQPFGGFNPSFHGQSQFGAFPWNTNGSYGNWNSPIPFSHWTNWNNWNTFGSFPWSWNQGYGFNNTGWQSPISGWNSPISCATPFSGECFPGCCPPSFGSSFGANYNPFYTGSFNNWSTPFNTFGFNPWSTIPFSQYGYGTNPFSGYNSNPFYGNQGGYNWPIPSSNVPFGFGVPMTNYGQFSNAGYNGVYPQGFPFPGTPCGPQNTDIHGKPGFGMNREAA